MDIILAEATAYRYWMRTRRVPSAPVPAPNRYSLSLTKREMELLVAEYGLSLPIHTLITSENDRRKHPDLVCHYESTGRVSCVVPVHEGLAVSSPELCFLQRARRSTLQELVF